MKLKILIFLFLLSCAKITLAQDKLEKLFAETTADERATFQTSRMKGALALSSEQEQKVFEINLKYTQKMEHVFRLGGGKLQRLKKMKAVGNQKDSELRSVLDNQQFQRYEQIKEEMRETMQERRKG